MTVTVLSNKAAGFRGNSLNGIGGRSVLAGLSWLGLQGAANDIYVVSLAELVHGDINQGVFFQASAGVSLSFSLANPGLAKDPDPTIRDSAPWGNVIAVGATAAIVAAPVLFTAVKITFTNKAVLYIGAR